MQHSIMLLECVFVVNTYQLLGQFLSVVNLKYKSVLFFNIVSEYTCTCMSDQLSNLLKYESIQKMYC